MTQDTYDDLSLAIGRKLTNQEWIKIIAENYEISNNTAKDMLSAALRIKNRKLNIQKILENNK